MNLREQLASRLISLFGGVPNPGGLGWDDCLKMADECLRQMEWTDKQTFDRPITEPIVIDQSQFPGMRGIRILGLRPLTIAPLDWKP